MAATFDPYSLLVLEAWVLTGLYYGLLVVKAWALGDAAIRRNALFVAGDKQSKAFWMLLLAVFLAVHILRPSPLNILNLVGTVAAFVYLADVRPTLRSMQRY